MPLLAISSSSITSISRLVRSRRPRPDPPGRSGSGCLRARSRGRARGWSLRRARAPGCRRRHRRNLPAVVLNDRELCDLSLGIVVRLGLVAKELVGAEERSLRRRLRARVRVETADASPVHDRGDVRNAGLAASPYHLCREVANGVNVEVIGLPQPGHEHARRRDLPEVWTSVRSPAFPRMSPNSMSLLIAPSRARSTAPVAPLGLFTPSNRLTTTTSASVVLMSPSTTDTSIVGPLPEVW